MSLLSELFSDLFARQDNALARIDARTKLIMAFTTLIALIFSTSPVLPLLMMVACVVAGVCIGVPGRFIAIRLLGSMGIAGVLLVLKSIMTGATPLWSMDLLGWKLVISREGLHSGIQMGARVLGSMSVMLLLSLVTPAHQIFRAMRSLGVPQVWVEIALLMYRYIFVLLDLLVDLTAAQRVRLGYSGARRALASAGMVAGTIVLRSVDQATRTSEAMRVRGYRGEIPLGPMPPMLRRDWATIVSAVTVIGALMFASERLWK
jgi:cobalt/nickel transport system permease protein